MTTDPIGPECFGGSDDESHYMAQTRFRSPPDLTPSGSADLARIQRAWAAAKLTPSPPSPAVDAPHTTGTDGAPGDTAGVAPLGGGGDSPTFEAWDDERNAVLLEGVPGPLFGARP